MCGIVGFTGHRAAAPLLLEGLSLLEYRGYDSAGLAVRDGDEPTQVVKAMGKLRNLAQKTENGAALPGCCGIGHTRWATHGEPSEENAHPHISANAMDEMGSEVVGVHNGIIENYAEIKQKLLNNGYRFYSGTDTEVAIKLVDYYYRKYRIGPIDAINRMMVRVRGSYALALLFKDYPGEIYAARKDSPLVIGVGDGETFLASDVPALLQHTRDVYYIENHQSARLLPGEAHFFDLNGDEIELPLTHVTWSAEAAQKGGYEHFMIKEIHEQPQAVKDTLSSLIQGGRVDLSAAGLSAEHLAAIQSVHIVACGSAWHVGMSIQYVIEDLCEVPVRVELASEFRYRKRLLGPGALVIVISQSGETADSLAALRAAKDQGAPTLAVVNVVGSSIAREADHVLYTLAGPEIAVATTKAYSAQLAVFYLITVALAEKRGKLKEAESAAIVRALEALPGQIEEILTHKETLQQLASKYFNNSSIFFIGRNLDYAISLEGSLKLKEISYIHSEAYAGGELKHGTISLIEPETLVIAVATYEQLFDKLMSNVKEVTARKASVFCVAQARNAEDAGKAAADCFFIPDTHEMLTPSLACVPLQLFAYYVALNRGCDIDKPRNLAKSVTVE